MKTLLKSKYANPMKKLIEYTPAFSRTDKLSLVALVWVLITTVLFYELIDNAAIRAAEAEKPPEQTITIKAPPIDCTPLVEAIEALRADRYDETIPLTGACQRALWEACEDNNVPVCLALGLIEVESDFQPDAENGVSYGLCQLNKKYWPEGLTPEGNIQCGISHLGELLEEYGGDELKALTAYNRGKYKGVVSQYARNVLDASEKYRKG